MIQGQSYFVIWQNPIGSQEGSYLAYSHYEVNGKKMKLLEPIASTIEEAHSFDTLKEAKKSIRNMGIDPNIDELEYIQIKRIS